MARSLFRAAAIPRRLIPAAVVLGTSTLHHVGAAGHALDPERDPDAVLRHDAVRCASVSAFSPPSSCWPPDCGGCIGQKLRPAAPARIWRRRLAGCGRARGCRRAGARARNHGTRVRPGGAEARTSQRRAVADRQRCRATGRRRRRQSRDVACRSAAARRLLSRRTALRQHVTGRASRGVWSVSSRTWVPRSSRPSS